MVLLFANQKPDVESLTLVLPLAIYPCVLLPRSLIDLLVVPPTVILASFPSFFNNKSPSAKLIDF